MKIAGRLGLVLMFLLLLFSVKAQTSKDLVLVADEMYKFGDKLDAMDVYKQALDLDGSNAYINYMVGKCYIETIHKAKSLPYFINAMLKDPGITPNILYLVGFAYHLNYKFDSAVYYYNKYRSQVQMDDSRDVAFEIKKIERRIYECGNAREFVKNPMDVEITNIGSIINTKHADYAPVVSADQSTLYFTSRRSGSTGDNKDVDNEYYEDIYVSFRKDSLWSVPENLGEHINTKFHDASIGVSSDGKQLFIYRDDDKNTGDIFYCKKTSNGEWSKPKPLDGINTNYIENSISISSDGKILYFSSNRPGGYGGMDIYMSKLNKSGTGWDEPVNLGTKINTEYDDEGPFISTDGKTLYFCSRGHEGMGGMDLYKSENKNNEWQKPENLKYPINSVDDDLYFVTSGDGVFGYYASIKEDVVGNVDIYRICFSPQKKITTAPEKKVDKLAEERITFLIQVRDKETKLPLNSIIEVIDNSNNKLISSGSSENGVFQFESNTKDLKGFTVHVKKEGYIFKAEGISISQDSRLKEYTKTIDLMKVKVGTSVVLRNIYFDFDKEMLKKESEPELERLLTFIKENGSITIEIRGHTDYKGSYEYNLVLSQKRAEEVVNWLIQHGIDGQRLKAKGYGESRPLASNDDEEEGRELNRRTEFMIVSYKNAAVITHK